jgi:hypothetical protein
LIGYFSEEIDRPENHLVDGRSVISQVPGGPVIQIVCSFDLISLPLTPRNLSTMPSNFGSVKLGSEKEQKEIQRKYDSAELPLTHQRRTNHQNMDSAHSEIGCFLFSGFDPNLFAGTFC